MGNTIIELTKKLEKLYPVTGMYGSKASLYGDGLKDKVITSAEYDAAQQYYGRLWHYAGD